MEKIRIFLAEDEVIIRNGIKKSIDWEREGYTFVGEASDGELAYPIIIKEKPDILITDIRMPFMDGLELSRLVKEALPEIRILILSGYNEFQYAKDAIRIGVTDYLLKPISSAKLLEVLEGVKQSILQERQEKELLRRYTRDMRENIENEKSKLFVRLVMNEFSMSEAVEEGKKYGMNLSAACYTICLFKLLLPSGYSMASSGVSGELASRQQEAEREFQQATEAVEKLSGQLQGICMFHRGDSGWAFLLLAEDEGQRAERVREFVKQLHLLMSRWKRVEYFGSIGKGVDRIRNLKASFQEADKVFASRFTEKPNQILSLEDLSQQTAGEEMPVTGFVQVGEARTVFKKFLNDGTREEIQDFCRVYTEQIIKEHLRSVMLRQYVVMDIFAEIFSFCEKMDAGDSVSEMAGEMQASLQSVHSPEQLQEYLGKLLTGAIEIRDAASGKKYTDIIAAAREEIEQRYMTEEISLNSVAAHVGMSPSYFSSIFSKEAGKTFVEYLTEVRMEKAREYLMCSSMKTSEIAFEVGYRDPHYFSYIFKKTQGCSPKEYRARRKG